MTFQDFLMNSPSGGLMIKVGDGTPIGGMPPWITSDTVNGGLMFKVNAAGYTPPDGMLQTGTALNATLQVVNDNVGTNSPLQLSTTQINFGAFTGAATGNILWRANGTLTDYTGWHQSDGDYKLITKNASPIFINIANGLNFANGFSTQGGFNSSGFYVGTSSTQNGALTIKGSGGNILSLRDSSDVEKLSLTNAGVLTWSSGNTIYNDGSDNFTLSANGGSGKALRLVNLNSAFQINGNWVGGSTDGAFNFLANTTTTSASVNGLVAINSTISPAAGAASFRLLNFAYTINTSGAQTGTATGIFLNATETALNGMTHNLMDLQVGGVSKFSVSTTSVKINSYAQFGAAGSGLQKGQINIISDSTQYFLRLGHSSLSGNNETTFVGDGNGAFEVKFNGTTTQYWDYQNNVTIGNRNAYGNRLTIIGKALTNAAVFYDSGIAEIATFGVSGGNTTRFSGAVRASYINTYDNGYSMIESLGSDKMRIGYSMRIDMTKLSVGINTSSIDNSAQFQIDSTTTGFLMPRQTTAQINAIATPANGLQVYNTDLLQPCFYDGTGWRKVSHSSM
jgi:hypothetical protein